MVIRAVFFDIDDTLVQHTAAMHAATVALHGRLAPEVRFDEFHARWKTAHARHYPRFLRGEASYVECARGRLRDAVDPAITDAAADEIFAMYLSEYESGWALYDDVIPCLDKLRHVPLGVISNGRTTEQKRKLKTLGVADRFSCVCVSEELGIAKPAAEMFLHACGELGIAAADALYVGDQYELDACAAAAAGLRSVWLNRRGIQKDECGVRSISSLDGVSEWSALRL